MHFRPVLCRFQLILVKHFSDGFLTDSQISAAKVNGEVPMKELEHWVPEGVEDSELHDLHAGGELGLRRIG